VVLRGASKDTLDEVERNLQGVLKMTPTSDPPPIHVSQDPKACSVVLRGASKDTLNEVERNLQDAMGVARNVVADPRLVPGGGAAEMAVSRGLKDRASAIQGERL